MQLGGLAQAHVVGQAGAEALAAQRLQPGETPELVGTKRAGEALGGRRAGQPGSVGAALVSCGQQRLQPAVGGDAFDREPARTSIEARSEAKDVQGGEHLGCS